MRVEKKYVFMLAMALAMVILLSFVGARETRRMAVAADGQAEELIALGAKTYAANCAVCHGPQGEGVVGMPLRERLAGDPEKDKDLYNFIFRTIARGRPGSGDPKWVKVTGPDGKEHWLSYTAMPAWHRDEGGPLDDYHVKALVYFLMQGNRPVPYIVHHTLTERDEPEPGREPAWSQVPRLIARTAPPNVEVDASGNFDKKKTAEKMPKAQGLSDEENNAARMLFVDKFGCIQCHTVGSVGGRVGPDLSKVGAWTDDPRFADFLRAWIKNAPETGATRERMPVYWSKHRPVGETKVPAADSTRMPREEPLVAPGKVIGADGKETSTAMPNFSQSMTDQERDLLVRYLLGLK